MRGVKAFFSAKDIPGKNSFTPKNHNFIIFTEDEPIFLDLDSEVQFFGQPAGMIVARTMALANEAAKLVSIQYEKINEEADIIPSLSLWLIADKPRKCVKSEKHIYGPNTSTKYEAIGQAKKIAGESYMESKNRLAQNKKLY